MPLWWNGIHATLKKLCREACGFESHRGYMTGKIVAIIEPHTHRYPDVKRRDREKTQWTVWQCPCGQLFRFEYHFTLAGSFWEWTLFTKEPLNAI